MSKQNKYDLENIPRVFDFPCKVLEFGWLPNHFHWHNHAVVEGCFVCLSCNYTEKSVMLVDDIERIQDAGEPPRLSLLPPGTVLNTVKPGRHDEIFFRYSAAAYQFLTKFFRIKENERFNIFFQGFPADILSELGKAADQLSVPGSADRIDMLAIRLFSEAVLCKITTDISSARDELKLNAIAGKLANGQSLETLLKEYGLSERSFYRKWNEVFDLSPREYVISMNLQKACSLLTASNMPIDDIALECGFVNSNYFYKMFRLKLNTTPGAYRKKSLLAQE